MGSPTRLRTNYPWTSRRERASRSPPTSLVNLQGKRRLLRASLLAPVLPFGRDMSHLQPGAGPDRSLLIDDAAERLGVSRRTIYYRIRQGRLQTIRTRCGSQRVLVSSIELLLQSSREADARRGIRWAGRGPGADG